MEEIPKPYDFLGVRTVLPYYTTSGAIILFSFLVDTVIGRALSGFRFCSRRSISPINIEYCSFAAPLLLLPH